MLYCNNCKVFLPGAPKRCPLCKGSPVGRPSGSPAGRPAGSPSGASGGQGDVLPSGGTFPHIPLRTGPSRPLLMLISFFTVAAAGVCVSINLILPVGGWWSLFVLAGMASLWVTFAVMLKKRNHLPKSILWQVAVIALLAYLWDRFTGFHGWSVDYVLPILCTCAIVAMSVVARIRKLHIQFYILYLILLCVLGILTFVLIVVGKVRVVVPSAICFATTVISLASLLFFEGKVLWAEIQRRLHL